MKFKKNDKIVNDHSNKYTVHDAITNEGGGTHYVLIGGRGIPIVLSGDYVERFYILELAPKPGEFYVSSRGSVFMVDDEHSIWLVSDRFDGHHKIATNSHQGRWAGTLTYWEKSMGFGPLKKIDIPKFDIRSL